MIIICEVCGKKYKIDPDKLKKKRILIKCKMCKAPIEIVKPRPKISPPDINTIPDDAIFEIPDEEPSLPEGSGKSSISATQIATSISALKLFAIITPLILILIGAFVYLWFF
jgi:hypothetical protein